MKEKKRDFGLAAQLTQPRVTPSSQLSEAMREIPIPTSLPISETIVGTDIHDEVDQTSQPLSHLEHTDPLIGFPIQKKPGAPQRAGGYVRRTITLSPALSDYVDQAWRTHRNVDGTYVKGVSGFIEAVIDEHRRQAK